MDIKHIVFQTLGLLFPARCPGCNKITQRYELFCDNCLAEIKTIKNQCRGCGNPQNHCCCAKNKIKLNIVSPFRYDGVISTAIQRFKFNGEKIIVQALVPQMIKSIKQGFPDVSFDFVTYVPQTDKRLRERGFNQSAILAKSCAKELGLPCNNVLIKTRNTKDQHTLKAKDRISNLKGAFSIEGKADINGKTVLLCDDIKTTGATLNECSKELLRAGAKEVCCVTAAVVYKDN